jgi:hypothetical protein
VEDVLTFIQDYVDDRKAPSTIRSVYSALLFHFRLYGRETFLTENPIIQMFVEGAQRLAPPSVRKCVVWNPETPLSFIEARQRPRELREAGKEALVLLLLATGIRVDCASKLSFSINKHPTFCQIPYLLARKTGYSEPQVISCFEEKPRLCPVNAIEHFLQLSRSVRKPTEQFLFISSKGKRAHIDTLRHWVTELLAESGVETTAGSCRSASSSAAKARDVEIDIILKSAGWARESTFRRFYQRQVLKINEGYNLVRSMQLV